MSQRVFYVILSVAIVSAAILGAAFAQPGAQRITNAVPDVDRPLPLSAVRLTGGPLKQAQDFDAAYLLALEPDRMLAFYRQRAGLEPKAQPYGGWDGDDRNLTGHIAGHHLSAISLMWQATEEGATQPAPGSPTRVFQRVGVEEGCIGGRMAPYL
jgi:DUF1680 family protein